MEVVCIAKEEVDRLYAQSATWATIGRLIAESAYHHTHHRALSLLTQTAAERYRQLVEEHPGLLEIAPQHYVASYLGVTPQSLSRIRRQTGVTKCE